MKIWERKKERKKGDIGWIRKKLRWNENLRKKERKKERRYRLNKEKVKMKWKSEKERKKERKKGDIGWIRKKLRWNENLRKKERKKERKEI